MSLRRVSFEMPIAAQPFLFLAPAIIVWLAFFVFPLFFTIILSFNEWNLVSPSMEWVGLDNYRSLLEDGTFWKSFANTFIFAGATVIPSMALSLGLAMLVEHAGKLRQLFRTLLYLPVVASLAVTALVWSLLLSPQEGLVNEALSRMGLYSPNWLNDPAWALLSLVIVSVWKTFGGNMILYIIGLKNLDKQLFEAARVDGAGIASQFWRISFPLLKPVHLFVVLSSVIQSFQLFTAVHIMTQGGPNNATNVLVYQVWQEAFKFFDIGRSSALALIVFLLVLGIAIAQIRLTEKEQIYDYH